MPLLSLIDDQVSQMEEIGVSCKFLKTQTDLNEVIRDPTKYKILFITPEKIVQNKAAQNLLSNLYNDHYLNRFVIDEVH